MSIVDDMDDGQDPEERAAREKHSDGEPVEFANVTCLRETEKAILIRRPGGDERWVPTSQIDDSSEVYTAGQSGKIIVTAWFASKWNETQEAKKPWLDAVAIPDVVCLRETAKAIVVRVGVDGEEFMLPKSQVLADSEVRGDGDLGTLRITAWIAKQKGISE